MFSSTLYVTDLERNDLRETGIDGKNWIRLAQVRVQWRALVNTVKDFTDQLSECQLLKDSDQLSWLVG